MKIKRSVKNENCLKVVKDSNVKEIKLAAQLFLLNNDIHQELFGHNDGIKEFRTNGWTERYGI